MKFEKCVEDLATYEGWQKSYSVLIHAGQAALEPILAGTKHSDWKIRMWCIDFMDHFADERCIEALVVTLDDPMADVRRHAVHSIGCQDCKSTPLKVDVVALLINKALHDSSIRVRRVAAHMLGNQGADRRIVSALSKAINKEKDAKFKANATWAIQRAAA